MRDGIKNVPLTFKNFYFIYRRDKITCLSVVVHKIFKKLINILLNQNYHISTISNAYKNLLAMILGNICIRPSGIFMQKAVCQNANP